MRRVLQVLLPLVVIGIGVSVSILLVIHKKQVHPDSRQRFKPRIETVGVALDDFQPTTTAQGTVKPHTVINLSPEISGRVIFVSPKLIVGGLFDEGEELVRIDARDYELALKQSNADINTAQAQITNAMAQLSSAAAHKAQSEARIMREEAEANAARAEWVLLGKKTKPPDILVRIPQIKEARAGISSAIAMSSAANAQKQSASALVKAAEAAQELAELNVKRCVITAPFRCRVQSRSVGIGLIASRSSVLAQLQSVDYAEIPIPLSLDKFRYLQITNAHRGGASNTNGPPVTVTANGNQWSGLIVRSEGEIRAGTQMMAVVARVSDPYGEAGPTLNFGQFVSAAIQGRIFRNIAILPVTVLHDGDLVYVANKSKLHSRKVKVFWRNRKIIAISSGLKNDERVCVSSLDSFVEGMDVTVVSRGRDE